jgi:hypothetical protein
MKPRRFATRRGFQQPADLLEQGLVVGRLIQNVRSPQLECERSRSFTRGGIDENDWNMVASRSQMTLKLQPTHARQLHIKNEAPSALCLIGPNELLRGWEDFRQEACCLDEFRKRLSHRVVRFNDRNERDLSQGTSHACTR